VSPFCSTPFTKGFALKFNTLAYIF